MVLTLELIQRLAWSRSCFTEYVLASYNHNFFFSPVLQSSNSLEAFKQGAMVVRQLVDGSVCFFRV